MITTAIIREDLKNIRYYYSRQSVFDTTVECVGKNKILGRLQMYNDAICEAPPKLYDLYVSLYLHNNTQDSLSEKWGYTIEHISRMHSKLVKFFLKQFTKEEK